MKLLYTNFHSGSGGGHTTYIRELAKGLANDHEVHVAAPAGSRLLAEAQALPEVHAFAQEFPNGLKKLAARRHARRRLHDYLLAHAFDVVHVNGSADHRLVISARRGLPVRPHIVLTKHNTKPLTGLQHWWRARFGTDKVIAVCEYVREQLQATPYRRCAPETIYNGVDVTAFAPWPDDQALAERLRLAPDNPALLIGSSAGTADYKGWTDLAQALQRLDDAERRQIRIVVAGQPPSRAQCERVAQTGTQENFIFPGLLEDVRPVIAAIDAGFVLSHDVETISFACREMMSMGKPVMVSRYAGLPENIHPGKDGWVVPVHGIAEMAETLRWMLRHRPRLRAMGEQARRHALSDFDAQIFVMHTARRYRDLLAPAHR